MEGFIDIGLYQISQKAYMLIHVWNNFPVRFIQANSGSDNS